MSLKNFEGNNYPNLASFFMFWFQLIVWLMSFSENELVFEALSSFSH